MSADFWAGYVSGAVGILIGNPLDLVKTRLQAGRTVAASSESHTGAAAAAGGASPQSFKQHFDRAGTLVRGKLFHLHQLSRHHPSTMTASLDKQ